MTRYIIRRLLQAIPLLFIISLVLFVLMQSVGDPLATMSGRMPTRKEDRERLTRQLGLDKPILVQYLYWLVGNDWTKETAWLRREGCGKACCAGILAPPWLTEGCR
jgi:peptide/nickel transport system permease protein